MNKSILEINHNLYNSFSDFLIGIEEGIKQGNDSFYTLIISGTSDPLISPLFNNDWHTNLVRIDHLGKRMKTRLNIQINTRLPIKFEKREFKEIFHVFPVGLNYYIGNNNFDWETQFVSTQDAIKKLETWDSKNPMKTKIILDIDNTINLNRLNEIKSALNKTFIQVSTNEKDNFRHTYSNSEHIVSLIK